MGAARSATCRRRVRSVSAAVLGAMSLVVGAAAGQDSSGGADAAASRTAVEQILAPGDDGAAVRALQRKLGVRADGEYGPRTRRAVRRFQRRSGIAVDGVAGPATLAALGVKVSAASVGPLPAVLERIAECESGGNPAAVSPDGQFRGKYQFLRSTWRALGGKGDPAKASEARQDRIAVKLFKAQGAKPWPNCGAA